MIRVGVAVVLRKQISVFAIFAGVLALAASASGQSDFEDLRLSLRADSRLIFVGGAGNPASLFLGSEDSSPCPPGETCAPAPRCKPIEDADGYGITVRVYRDRRSPSDPNSPDPNNPFDNARFRVCSGAECSGTTTPVDNADLSQEDGVARVAVTEVDLPEGACVITQPTSSFFFEFKRMCNATLSTDVPGHRAASLTPGISSEPDDPNAPNCEGALEDQGFGRFSEAVFADPNAPDPDDYAFIPLLPQDPNLAWEARQNALRLKLPLVGVQRKFGGLDSFTADVDLAFQVTTGLVGGKNIPVPNTIQRVVALGSGSNGAPVGGTPLDQGAGTLHLAGGVATSANAQGTPPSLYNIWGNSIAFLDLNADVTPLTDTTVASALGQVFPDHDGDGDRNATDPDDDNDGLLDDGTVAGAVASDAPHPDDECSTGAGSPSNPGECLQGNFEASFLASVCSLKSGATNSLDADSDDDGLTDGTQEDVNFDGCRAATETDPADPDTDDDVLNDGYEVSTAYARFDPGFVPPDRTNPLDADTDNDGLSDGAEVNIHLTEPLVADTDLDGLVDGYEVDTVYARFDPGLDPPTRTNPLVADSDGDGLSDGDEVNTHHTEPLVDDTDVDGLTDAYEVQTPYALFDPGLTNHTNPLVADTDGDGLLDGAEVSTHLTEPLVADSDGDGSSDGYEVATVYARFDLGLGPGTNPLVADTDGDGLLDGAEVNVYFTEPLVDDTDVDGLTDADEVLVYLTDPNDTDSDDDGLSDFAEVITYLTNPNDADSDDDLLSDGAEINNHGTNPNDVDSDDDGLSDGAEVLSSFTNPLDADSDDDGLLDGFEVAYGFDPLVGGEENLDADADGLTNYQEALAGTNPTLADTDGDGLLDAFEVTYGLDPLVTGDEAGDPDNDGLTSLEEQSLGTNPIVADTDGDTYEDGDDNCALRSNDQSDVGGISSAAPDGIGDACQCGDVDDDGDVDLDDADTYRDSLADPADLGLSPAGVAKCSVIESAAPCGIVDVAVIARALELTPLEPGIGQVCTAATGP